MFASLLLLSFVTFAGSTITSDTGCSCVVTKTALTAPGAGASIAAGCSARTDWLGQLSTWCLTDQSLATCGTLQPGFGYVDTCQQAAIIALNASAPQLEWDQTPTTFYTGQLINISWSTNNIQPDEQFRLTYLGTGRTNTIVAAVNNSAGSVTFRPTDATSSLTPYAVPIQITSTTNPSISFNSTPITVLQSKVQNANVYNNGTLVNTGTVTILGQNVTITWRGLGTAQIGSATVTIKSSGGGGGGTTVGTPITTVAAGNNTVYYTLPLTFVPSGFTTYTAQITVTGPSAPYTASSAGFRLAAGPTPSSTPSATPTGTPSQTPSLSFGASSSPSPTPSRTQTPTPTSTPTPSLSTGATASNTPTISVTSSVTPSQTPTISVTSSSSASSTTTPSLSASPTPSQTPAPSVDILGAARAAAEEANNKNAAIGGGVAGGLFVAGILGFIAYKAYERKQLRERRLRKQRASHRNALNRDVYGISEEKEHAEKPTVVMYQIQGLPRNSARHNQLAGYQSRNTRNL